ncbi:MAG: amidohydrolase [Armatimonadetes bacterium]|nr:amidohydrolase [Armatimonadota bacterium]
MSLRQRIDQDADFLAAFRQDLHQHPELMYEEHRTSEQVRKTLEQTGIQFKAGLAGGTGILAYLPASGEKVGTVALRADMDALPIHEETGLPYASQTPGKMHACGHDGHTAILLGALRALVSEENRPNDILFMFQPAEEGGAGGERMCQDGVLNGTIFGEPVDYVFGLHGWPAEDVGQFFIRNGPMLAATDEFRVTIHGQGGHAATPHLANDPVVASAQVITALQSVASRNADPLDSIVFTVGAINGGAAHNVIPEAVSLKGTMRTLLPETREMGKKRFYEIVEGISLAMGCKAEIDWHDGYPVTFNDSVAADRFRDMARKQFGDDRLHELEVPIMGGEDFSYYGLHAPAAFYFVGLRREGDENPANVHTPRFDFNDAVIPDCVEAMCRLALDPVK